MGPLNTKNTRRERKSCMEINDSGFRFSFKILQRNWVEGSTGKAPQTIAFWTKTIKLRINRNRTPKEGKGSYHAFLHQKCIGLEG